VQVAGLDLMSILYLLGDELSQSLIELVFFLGETRDLLFVFQFHGGKLIAKVFVLILKLFILGPDPGPLVLCFLPFHF
jgi:hypothetical protein